MTEEIIKDIAKALTIKAIENNVVLVYPGVDDASNAHDYYNKKVAELTAKNLCTTPPPVDDSSDEEDDDDDNPRQNKGFYS